MADDLEKLMGLGGYIQPQPIAEGGGVPPAGGGWSSFLNDPVNRAGLLSFGLQALTGGWGNGAQQLGAAIGAGAQGMGATAGHLQDTAEKNRAFTSKENEGAANRASHEKIANIAADSRLAVAQERVAGMLQRAQLIHGPKDDAEWKFLQSQRAEGRKVLNDTFQALKMTPQQVEEAINSFATNALQDARNKGVFSQKGGGQPASSASGVGQPAPSAPGSAPSAQQGQAPNATSETPKGASFEQLRAMPGFDQKIVDPAWKAQLLKARPDLSTRIQLYEREMMAKGARKNLYGME